MSPRAALIIGVVVVAFVVGGVVYYISDWPGAITARGFFTAQKDALSGLSTALSIIGFAAVVVTFMLGLNTLRMTVNQNRAKVSFDVYKEVRAFFEKKQDPQPDVVFNFYLSLHEQKEYGNVSTAFWSIVRDDLSNLFALPEPNAFRRYWEERGPRFPKRFRKEVDSLVMARPAQSAPPADRPTPPDR